MNYKKKRYHYKIIQNLKRIYKLINNIVFVYNKMKNLMLIMINYNNIVQVFVQKLFIKLMMKREGQGILKIKLIIY